MWNTELCHHLQESYESFEGILTLGKFEAAGHTFSFCVNLRDQEEPIAIPVSLSIVSNALEKWFKGPRDCFGSQCANSVVLCWLLVCSIVGL